MDNAEIDALLDRSEFVPTLVLYDGLCEVQSAQKEEISTLASKVEKRLANPLDVALESMINFQAEAISCKKYGCKTEKVIISHEIVAVAMNDIQSSFKDAEELINLHDRWLQRLTTFLVKLYHIDKALSLDEVIYRVSEHFRISTNSAIRAITSINKIGL
jgi:hypothetical protein